MFAPLQPTRLNSSVAARHAPGPAAARPLRAISAVPRTRDFALGSNPSLRSEPLLHPDASGAGPAERQADVLGRRIARDLSGLSAAPGRLSSGVRRAAESHLHVDLGDVELRGEPGATAREGALAFTLGSSLSFAPGALSTRSSEGRFLLGHELTHAAQQRASGRHVVQRYSAFTVDEQTTGAALGWRHPAGRPLRISDDGLLAVEDNGWGPGTNKRAWARPSDVSTANATLAARGSRVELEVQSSGTLSGHAPVGGSPRTLRAVAPKNPAAGTFSLPSDCGDACRMVMGSSGGRDVAVLKDADTGEVRRTRAHTYHGGDPTTPELFFEEVLEKEFGSGLSRSELYARYAALSPDAKRAFDRKYGINLFADPSIGQGLTVSTEKDMPGFHPTSGFTWNFHYAGVVLRSGGDYVTLESAAGWDADDWIFSMYGTRVPAQTFHAEQGGTQTHGSHYTTMVVEPERPGRNEPERRNLLLLDVGTSFNGGSVLLLTPTYRRVLGSWLNNRLNLGLDLGGRFAIGNEAAPEAGTAAFESRLNLTYNFVDARRGPFLELGAGGAIGRVVPATEGLTAAGVLRGGVGLNLGRGRIGIYTDVIATESRDIPLLGRLFLGGGVRF